MALYLGKDQIYGVMIQGGGAGIDTSDATALASHIQKGQIAYVDGERIIGTLEPSSADIKVGSVIAGVTGSFTSDSNAEAGHIQSGKTAYVNGSKVTGTLAPSASDIKTGITIAGVTGTFTSDANATAAQIQSGKIAYVNGSKVTGTLAPAAGNIKVGVTIAGVTGTFTSDANATAAQILSGKTAYVNGSKVTGTIASKAAATYYATTADQTIAAGQYLSGVQTIKKLTASNLSAANIKTGVTVTVNNGNANVYSVAGTYTSDATATAFSIQRGYIAYVKGSKITGTGPKITYSASAPTSGMRVGDIWVQTSASSVGDNNTITIASTSVSKAFTEWSNYSTYSRTLKGSASATITYKHSGSALTVSYKFPATLTNSGVAFIVNNGTFYYTLKYTDSSGTVSTLVNSSVAVSQGGSATPSGSVTLSTTKSGYFTFSYYWSLVYANALKTTATVTTGTKTQKTTEVRSQTPAVPSGSGGTGYVRSAAIWSGREWNEYRQFS